MAPRSRHTYDNFNKFKRECRKRVRLIVNYKGDDPLDPWFEYLVWLEQNFYISPSGNPTFEAVLVRCLEVFHLGTSKYKNDERLIKIYIKAMQFHKRQHPLYKTLISNGFGTEVPLLYINWAFYHERKDRYKKGMQILQQGKNKVANNSSHSNMIGQAIDDFQWAKKRRGSKEKTHPHYIECQAIMKSFRDTHATLRKTPYLFKSSTLQVFDRSLLMDICVPNVIIEKMVER